MSFKMQRSYRGKVQAVIFDWAGTTIDYGSMAPAGSFMELFRRHGVTATNAQARGPMGTHKRDHIASMLGVPEVAKQWAEGHGAPHTREDIEALFQEFIPLQLEALPRFCEMIPGAVATGIALRAQGIKIGGGTGYNTAMMKICADAAAKAGYVPDCTVAGDQVPAGRPAPWTAIKVLMELNIHPFESVVKVGDTVADVLEGLNGGMWTIGLTRQGNEVGLPQAELEALPATEQQRLVDAAAAKLSREGAHYVAESIAEVPALVAEINARLARGERP
ncbi:MAG: phosphonoacetaldehyde hydrolase [Candidatus Hydrogenedentes bacterium]|nr:phosphonoacetaldehyde hydrolase [Candidatus Hydrogenedentota bacterium]